jgi:2-phosphosulfolactate phosphatase
MEREQMMFIDLIISSDDIIEEKIQGKVVVVIDMLRATTVIITALKNGCNKVMPVVTVEEAIELSKENRESFILGGERRALKIEGFDCSNSPLEYSAEAVKDKTLIITTTNGTKAIHGSSSAEQIIIGAMINGKAVSEKLIELNKDVVFVNAGTYGQFTIDDFICSGYIINCILESSEAELSDIAFTAQHIYCNHKDITSYLQHARHFNVLRELGLEEDLKYCCSKDLAEIVPVYKDGIITK